MPRPPGFDDDRERFDRSTGSTFDPEAPADALVTLLLEVLLHPARAARMNVHHAVASEQPAFSELLDRLLDASWGQDRSDGMGGALQRLTQRRVLQSLMGLSANSAVDGQVRAEAAAALAKLETELAQRRNDRRRNRTDSAWRAHEAAAGEQLQAWREDPAHWAPSSTPAPPPGSPIGAGY